MLSWKNLTVFFRFHQQSTPREGEEGIRATPGIIFNGDPRPSPVTGGHESDQVGRAEWWRSYSLRSTFSCPPGVFRAWNKLRWGFRVRMEWGEFEKKREKYQANAKKNNNKQRNGEPYYMNII